MHYNYGILDGNFFLRRNFSAAKFAKTLLGEKAHLNLAKSFLSTVFNYKAKLDFDKLIIAWDKLPYKKLESITEYKQDRHYVTQDDIDQLTKQIAETEDEEEKQKLTTERDDLQYDLDCEQVFSHTKNSILSNLVDAKFYNMRISGYEADDLAYLISKYLASKGKSSVLISVDSDWLTFVQPNVDFYKEAYIRKRKEGILYTIDNATRMEEAQQIGCSLYEVGNLWEAYTGGHNNVAKYSHSNEITFIDFSRRILAADVTLPEFEYFQKRVAALNINNYDNQEVIAAFEEKINNQNDDIKARDYLKYLSPNLYEKYKSICGPKVMGGFLL